MNKMNAEFTCLTGSVKFENGFIYRIQENSQLLRHSEDVMNSNVHLDFGAVDTEEKVKEFIEKYGPLDLSYRKKLNLEERKYLLNNLKKFQNKKISNFKECIGSVEYVLSQAEIFRLHLRHIRDFKASEKIKSEYLDNHSLSDDDDEANYYCLNDEIERNYISSICAVNDIISGVHVSLEIDFATMKPYPYYKPRTLLQAIYVKVFYLLLGNAYISPCNCGCGRWFTASNTERKWYDRACAQKMNTKSKNSRIKSDLREKVYRSTYNHFKNNDRNMSPYIYQNHSNFILDDWNVPALEIKRTSKDFYTDLDNLCREYCDCPKCKSGYASIIYKKYNKDISDL